MKILEIPVQWYYDGSSKINVWRDSVRMMRELIQIRVNGFKGIYR